MLGVLAFSLVPYLRQSVRGGDWIGLGVILLVMLSIWLWSSWLKRVEVPDEWKEDEPRKSIPVKQQKETPEKKPTSTIAKTPAKTATKARVKTTIKTSAKTTKSRTKRS